MYKIYNQKKENNIYSKIKSVSVVSDNTGWALVTALTITAGINVNY